MLRHLRRTGGGEPIWIWFGHASYKAIPRKLRLFLLAACLHALQGRREGSADKLLALAERYCETAPGEEGRIALSEFYRVADPTSEFIVIMRTLADPLGSAAGELRRYAGKVARFAAKDKSTCGDPEAMAMAVESRVQCDLLRDIVGNPFAPVTLAPGWVTPTVRSLAQAAYQERQPASGALDRERVLVLADALEEAGAGVAVLEHLRGPGPHVQGCHIIDLILGKS